MNITVLYGTESGNAETVADDILEEFDGQFEVTGLDMGDAGAGDLDPASIYLVLCSTHGEGGLPASAVPFAEMLDEEKPDLSGIRYAMFGLGDSSYEIYSRGSERIDERLAALGAMRVGEYGRHDASDGSLPNDPALAWARETLPALAQLSEVAS